MKFRLLLFSALLFISYLALVSSSSGRATAAGEGNTGAPGDNSKVCASCHSGGSFAPTVNIRLIDMDGNEIDKYDPNGQYQVEVRIDATSGTPSGYGFQIVSLRDSDDTDVSVWSNPSSNAKIAAAMGRNYVEHNGVSDANIFLVEWTAPEEGTGSVSFYAAGNAVNKNGSTSGDAATTNSLQIEENAVSSLDRLAEIINLEVFPNPAGEVLNLQSDLEQVNIFIRDLSGKLIYAAALEYNEQLDISSWSSGQYIITAVDMASGAKDRYPFIKI